VICLHHSDNDGKCAGFWINQLAPRDEHEDKFYSVDYGIEVPWDDIQPNEKVYIVDFSIEPDDMRKLLDITRNVTWIDHHKSAIKKYENFNVEIPGIRDVSASGCMLTWWYFTKRKSDSDVFDMKDTVEAPEVTKLVDDYDMWKFSYVETRDFEAGFRLMPHGPEDYIWKRLCIDRDIELMHRIVEQGAVILCYRKQLMEDLIQTHGFESELDGHSCFCFNQAGVSSFDFESVDTKKYDVLVGFVRNKDSYNYSLRAGKDSVDVSEIAEKYGGGGHPGAAGFRSKDLLV
jgi:oligoribonuclease NrnB/cAMP/cGMP phosphodiesterase (DHH superfamily)